MVTKTLKLSEIKAADYNPRRNLKPDDEEYKSLKRSIETFGFVEPLIINERTMTIVGGHQRYKILRELGMVETEAIIVNLTSQDEKLLNVALNKIEGDWDMEKLSTLFDELNLEDLTVTGFNPAELDSLMLRFDEEPVSPLVTKAPAVKSKETDKKGEKKGFTIYMTFKSSDSALDWLEAHNLEGTFNKGRNIIIDMHGREVD